MPELPDVAGFKSYLDATALHQRIGRSRLIDDRIRGRSGSQLLSRRLKGTALHDTRRHGKFLFAAAGDAGWLVLHFGMTGELRYEQQEGDPPQYTRFVIEFDNGYRLVYLCRRMLGRVDFTDDLSAFIEAEQLGPDALDDDLTLRRFREMLAERRGTLKGLLLDQSFIAGAGNIWGDEVLFQAGLHPERRADTLDADEVKRLYQALRRVMRLGERRDGHIDKLPRSWMLPHRDDGGPCPRCGAAFERITVSGRTSHICPNCQAPP